MTAGRPDKFKKEYCNLLIDHMAPKLARKLKSVDAIGSSNVDLAGELEKALRDRATAVKLTEEDLAAAESTGVIETDEDDDDEDDEPQAQAA